MRGEQAAPQCQRRRWALWTALWPSECSSAARCGASGRAGGPDALFCADAIRSCDQGRKARQRKGSRQNSIQAVVCPLLRVARQRDGSRQKQHRGRVDLIRYPYTRTRGFSKLFILPTEVDVTQRGVNSDFSTCTALTYLMPFTIFHRGRVLNLNFFAVRVQGAGSTTSARSHRSASTDPSAATMAAGGRLSRIV